MESSWVTDDVRVEITRTGRQPLKSYLSLFQTFLENRIAELEAALEVAQKNELRDKQTINKLTKQVNRVSGYINTVGLTLLNGFW